MKNLALAALLGSGIVLFGTGFKLFQNVSGSGKVISEERNVTGFNQIHFSGSGRLTIVQGDTEKLIVTADDNIIPLIESEVSGGKLSVGTKNVSIRPTKDIQYQLSVKSLNKVSLSGSMKAQGKSLETTSLAVSISGSGSFDLDQLQADSTEVSVSGSGEIELKGQSKDLAISISGSGNFKGADLKTRSVTAKISGSGDAVVHAENSLEARISGSGTVKYAGQPHVQSKVSGSGKVKPL